MFQGARVIPKEEAIVVNNVMNANETIGQKGLGAVVETFLNEYFIAHEGLLPSTGLYNRVLQEVERPLLTATLKLLKGNQKRAAAILGINRNTLRKKLTQLNIDPDKID